MPYAFHGDQWVGFDDVKSFKTKVRPCWEGVSRGPRHLITTNNSTQNLFKVESFKKYHSISQVTMG